MSLTDENESTIISHTKKLISTQDEKKLMGLYSYYNEYNLQDEPNNLLLGNIRFIGIDYTREIPLLGFLLQCGTVIKREITDNSVGYECTKEFDYNKYITKMKLS
jgi:hypothetical protein